MVFLYGPMHFLENISIAFIFCQPLPGQYEYCSDRIGGKKYNPLSVPLKVWLPRLQCSIATESDGQDNSRLLHENTVCAQ